MKTIKFTLFGREIFMGVGYFFSCVEKTKPFTFKSLRFTPTGLFDADQAEMRVNGAYTIKVTKNKVTEDYCVQVYKSGRIIDFAPRCTKEEVTEIMLGLQDEQR